MVRTSARRAAAPRNRDIQKSARKRSLRAHPDGEAGEPRRRQKLSHDGTERDAAFARRWRKRLIVANIIAWLFIILAVRVIYF
jgi:hypothetical protein